MGGTIMTYKGTRTQWLDTAKGIAIILMVLGHTSIPQAVSNFIWSFHMPLFFIASGLATKWDKYTIKDYFFLKIRTLLVPFTIYSIIVLTVENTIGGVNLDEFIHMGWQGYALWFVPVLFFALLFIRIIQVLKHKWLRWVAVSTFLLVGFILAYDNTYLPWALSSVPYAAFLIMVGSELKVLNEYISKMTMLLSVLGFLICSTVSHFWRLDIAWNSILPFLPLAIGAIAGTLATFVLSGYINIHIDALGRILQCIGKETYIIMAFSEIIIMFLNYYFSLDVLIKYAILIFVLAIIKILKDCFNNFVGKRIL